MNCWASGKYVHLLYMYSILGRGSFCFNYWLNSAWRGGDQFVALLRWCEAQVSLTVAFSSSACFGLLFLIFLLIIPHRFSMFRSGEFAGQSSTQHHGHLTNFLLENEISIFKKLVSRRKLEVLKFLGKWVKWRWFSKNTMDRHQQMTLHPNHSLIFYCK